MNKYVEMIMDGLMQRYPEWILHCDKVFVNNGYDENGIYIKLGEEIPYAPIISCGEYVVRMERGTMTLEEVLNDIEKQLNTRHLLSDLQLADFWQIKDKLRVWVLNYESNKTFLEEVVFRRFLDLAITYRIVIELPDGMEASITVTHQLMEEWKIEENDLRDIAYHNTFCSRRVRIRGMRGLFVEMREKLNLPIEEILDFPDEEDVMFMVNMGNYKGGCVSILMKEAFRQFAKAKDSDLYILPASIYEVILVLEKHGMSCSELREIVREANSSAIRADEVLSDHVYMYRRETDEIVDLCE